MIKRLRIPIAASMAAAFAQVLAIFTIVAGEMPGPDIRIVDTPANAADNKIVKALLDPGEEPQRWLARLEHLEPVPDGTYELLLASPHSLVVAFGVTRIQIGDDDDELREKVLKVFKDETRSATARILAAQRLLKFPEAHVSICNAIVSELSKSEPESGMVSFGIQTLGEMGAELAGVRPILNRYLTDGSSEQACLSFVALGKLRSPSGSGPPTSIVLPGSMDDDWTYQLFQRLRVTERVTERNSDGTDERWNDALLKLVGSETSDEIPVYIRCEAINTLVAINPGDGRTVQAVLRSIAGDDPWQSSVAAELLGHCDPESREVIAALSAGLVNGQPEIRDAILGSLEEFASRANRLDWAVTPVLELLESFDGTTDHFLVAKCLSALAKAGTTPAEAGERIVSLLREESSLYQERPKREIVWLRSYIFSTLSKTGVPDSAFPFLLDAIANPDERSYAVHCGAAVRAVASMGTRARPVLPYLLEAFSKRLPLNDFSLERYGTDFPRSEATTLQIEIVRALEKINALGDPVAVELLDSLANRDGSSIVDERLTTEARRALEFSSRSPWLEADQRRDLQHLETHVTAQDGQATLLKQVFDRPTAVTFFYTRCTNEKKCCSAIGRLADLDRRLSANDIEVRLVAITFEPQHDTPERLAEYGSEMGLEFSDRLLMLQIEDAQQQQDVIQSLDIPVSYQDGWVSLHGIALVILDRQGRIARRYHTVLWDNEDIVKDLERLANEEP